MTVRANFEEFKERLTIGDWCASVQSADELHIGSSFDQNFLKDFKNLRPAVWLLTQSAYSLGNEQNSGYAQEFRQRSRIDVVLRLVVARAVDGLYNNEEQLTTLFNAVVNRLFTWRPLYSESNVFYVAHEDGPVNEAFMTVDLVVGYFVVKDA
jgi:hypothetical protein